MDEIRMSSRFIAARMWGLMSQDSATPIQALGEFPDNEVDVQATKIWVELNPDSVIITGNGHGMVLNMAPPDAEMLQEYFNDIERGQGHMDFDVREMFESAASLNSIQWKYYAVGFSGKPTLARRQSRHTRGMKGIGFLSFHQIGSQARYITRPQRELWHGYQKFDPNAPVDPPTFFSEEPTTEQIRRYMITPKAGMTDELLTDPDGNILEHGLQLVISHLVVDSESLDPDDIASHFGSRFSEDIRSGAVGITIIDRVTKAGRETPSGRRIVVEAMDYKGYLIVDKELFSKQANAAYRVALWYDPNGRGQKPMIRRGKIGQDVRPLTDFSEFEGRSPWATGKVSGFAEYPDAENWNTAKTSPQHSDVWRMWTRSLQDIADEVESKIGEMTQRAQEEIIQEVSNTVSKAARLAMQETEGFKDVVPGVEQEPSQEKNKGKKKRSRRQQLTVDAIVLDEGNRGVTGVTIELYNKKKLIDRQVTGRSGAVTFGEMSEGTYSIKMLIPEGMKPMDQYQQYPAVNIGPNQQGFRAIFHVLTGRPIKAPKPKLKRLVIWPILLAPGLLYNSGNLSRGVVEINSEGKHYQEAVERKDRDRIAHLTALYTASALAEYVYPDEEPSFVLLQANMLAGQMFGALKQIMAAENKSGSRRRKS